MDFEKPYVSIPINIVMIAIISAILAVPFYLYLLFISWILFSLILNCEMFWISYWHIFLILCFCFTFYWIQTSSSKEEDEEYPDEEAYI